MSRTVRSRATKAAAWATPPPRAKGRVWAGFLTAFLLGLAVAFLITSGNGPDATQRRIAELEREDAARDAAQLGPLTDQAKGTRDSLAPVLAAMAQAAPVDGSAPKSPLTSDAVTGWRDVVAAAEKSYEQSPSAGNGINVARAGLRTAVQQLAAAVRGFETALGVAEPVRSTLVALAGEQRTLALRTWSVAAVQLDVINIEAGRGHVHVQLSTGGDAGVIAPDGAPEGR
ncbi:hypothetical protein C8D88_12634 [Lentzea atacamensis]|uniref:Uncharacterized protein n=2 Tax=Lentzea TaxID=165301 RepID=A0A316HUI9_9PSEU|nr:hypothetical protein [Lentzea atacamensis]PWK78642.1 hypothetical protein C8D88_12634 [Lentzea atacamensis]